MAVVRITDNLLPCPERNFYIYAPQHCPKCVGVTMPYQVILNEWTFFVMSDQVGFDLIAIYVTLGHLSNSSD